MQPVAKAVKAPPKKDESSEEEDDDDDEEEEEDDSEEEEVVKIPSWFKFLKSPFGLAYALVICLAWNTES
jgi:hypothetical protein